MLIYSAFSDFQINMSLRIIAKGEKMEPEYLQADPAYRKKVLIVMGLILVGGFLALLLAMPWAEEQLRSAEPEMASKVVKTVYILLMVPLIVICVLMIRMARKSLKELQFPPSGTRVIKDTQIFRDTEAQKRAIMMIIFAGLIMLFGSASALLMFKLLS